MRLLARSLAPIALLSTASLFFAEAAWAAPIDVEHAEMNFGATSGAEQFTDIGVLAAENFTHRYDDIFSGVDGVVTVIDIDNLDSDDIQGNGANNLIDIFDEEGSSSGKRISLNIDIFGDSGDSDATPPRAPESRTGFTTFRVDFVAADTTTPVTLQNISVGVVDVDSNQFVRFAGISAYELSAEVTGPTPSTPTELEASETPLGSGAWEFKEPDGASSGNSDEENWVAVEYTSASSVTITAGSRESGGAFFGIRFADTTWPGGAPSPTRVTLTAPAYTVTYDANSADSGSVPTSQTSGAGTPTLTLAAPQGDLLRATCTFGGWNTRSDGTGANYVTGNSITLTANTTLYANWTCPPGSGGGGGGESAPPVVPTLAATGPSIAQSTVVGTLAGLLVASGTAAIVSTRYVGRRHERDVRSSA